MTLELQKPKFEVLYEDKDKIVLGQEWTSIIQGFIERKLTEYAVERDAVFFTKLFERMTEDELLSCQRIIRNNLKQRFNHD